MQEWTKKWDDGGHIFQHIVAATMKKTLAQAAAAVAAATLDGQGSQVESWRMQKGKIEEVEPRQGEFAL